MDGLQRSRRAPNCVKSEKEKCSHRPVAVAWQQVDKNVDIIWSSARVVNPRWDETVVCHIPILCLSVVGSCVLCGPKWNWGDWASVCIRNCVEQSQFLNQSISIALSGGPCGRALTTHSRQHLFIADIGCRMSVRSIAFSHSVTCCCCVCALWPSPCHVAEPADLCSPKSMFSVWLYFGNSFRLFRIDAMQQ